MTILIICDWGKNRSKYLADYLKQKGYETKFGGVYPQSPNPVTQDTVDWSHVIIFVKPEIEKYFFQHFVTNNQKIITLDVEDRMEILAPDKQNLTAEEWTEIQQKQVYPELERQVEKYLPFE